MHYTYENRYFDILASKKIHITNETEKFYKRINWKMLYGWWQHNLYNQKTNLIWFRQINEASVLCQISSLAFFQSVP